MAKDDTQVEQTEEQKTKAEQDAEAAFSSGFKNIRGESAEEKPKAEKEEEPKEEEIEDDKAKAAAPVAEVKPAAQPDPWEGVSPIVREHLEKLGQLPDRLRNVEGHIGGLKGTLNQMTVAAKAAATDKGAASPTEGQIAAAVADDAAFAKLKAEYPEWGNAIDQQMTVVEKRILQKVQKVDVSGLKNELTQESAKTAQQLRAEISTEIKEEMRLERKYENWRDTVNSSEFTEWLKAQPPVVQALTESARSQDAISLLDSFTEHQAAKAAITAPAEKSRSKEKSQQRLSAATTPKGTAQPPQSGVSDEEAFNRGFKKHARKA